MTGANKPQIETAERRPLDTVNMAADQINHTAQDADALVGMIGTFLADIKNSGIDLSTELFGKTRTLHISFPGKK